jgi:hypothetical protein
MISRAVAASVCSVLCPSRALLEGKEEESVIGLENQSENGG